MLRVFLSASVPASEDPIYTISPIDKQSIRDALMAALETILPHSEIVWGGHPSITALIASIVCDVWHKKDYLEHFHLYQSDEFKENFPEENALFPPCNIHITPKGTDLQDSLAIMRQNMLSPDNPIDIAIFMGGREEGLSKELRIFKKNHPQALILPLASTGGYSKKIYETCNPRSKVGSSESVGIPDELYDACKRYRYYTLFQRALQIAREQKTHN